MPRAAIIDRVIDEKGRVVKQFIPRAYRPVIPTSTAQELTRMMCRTVTHGTSRSAFYDPQGNKFLPGVKVAGKTGSLAEERPYRAYNWWVGFAPADDPKLAVSALVINNPRWRIKGSYVAREALRYYLKKSSQ
jgi:cell division protein FtsI/penicillin-binding protein 2